MSRLQIGLVAGLVLLVSLASSAPARLVAFFVSSEDIFLQAFRGTLWDGRANRALLRTPAGYLHLGAVEWELSPWSLLTLSPRLDVKSTWADQRFSSRLVLRGQGDVDFEGLELRASAALVRHLLPLALGGTVEGQFAELRLRDSVPVFATGRILWREGSWLAPQGPMRLGSYALEVESDDQDRLRGEVVTIAGPVEAQGEVGLVGKTYEIDVRVSAAESMREQLGQALSLVAAPEDDGYRVVLSGSIEG